jgi:hypothetical protein
MQSRVRVTISAMIVIDGKLIVMPCDPHDVVIGR